MRKLTLDVDRLSVESFATAAATRKTGTVRGHGDDCTWVDSCFCHTAYAVCGTGPQTIYSCTYTNDERCVEDTFVEPCARTAVDCLDTSYQVCGTRMDTAVC
jgi:hypothetical protein